MTATRRFEELAIPDGLSPFVTGNIPTVANLVHDVGTMLLTDLKTFDVMPPLSMVLADVSSAAITGVAVTQVGSGPSTPQITTVTYLSTRKPLGGDVLTLTINAVKYSIIYDPQTYASYAAALTALAALVATASVTAAYSGFVITVTGASNGTAFTTAATVSSQA